MDHSRNIAVEKSVSSWPLVLGYLIAVGGLAWVVHDVHWRVLWSDLRQLRLMWLLPAVVADVGSYLAQGTRWSVLLVPVGNLSPLRATEAVYIGLFTNELAPLRLGELVRTYLVSRWLRVDVARILSSVAVERVLDGAWLLLAFGLTAIFVPLPSRLEQAADILGIAILAAGLLLAVFTLGNWIDRVNSSAGKTLSRLTGRILHARQDMKALATTNALLKAFVVSSLILVGQGLAFWCVMKSYRLGLSPWAAMVVVLVVRLGTMIPNAPANIGSFQVFCVLGLTMFGVGKTEAAGFSFVVFLVLTLPLWALGLMAVLREGLTCSAIRRQSWRTASY